MRAFDLHSARIQAPELREVYLDGLGLKQLPPFLQKSKQLEVLDLQHNQLEDIPAWLSELASLRVLRLSGNPLKQFPMAITRLPVLQTLELAGCQIDTLPAAFQSEETIQKLDFSQNKLKKLPDNWYQLSGLKELNLSRNRIRQLADQCHYPSLQTLHLAQNRLEVLPENKSWYTTLESIDISKNRIKRLPATLFQATFLRRLFLNQNQLKSIQAAIQQLRWLRILELAKNELNSIPALDQCRQLQRLSLSHNPIQQLPPLPPGLQELALANTSLQQLSSLRKLAKLRRLNLRSTLPPETEVPDVLFHLHELTHLQGLSHTDDRNRLLRLHKAANRLRLTTQTRQELFYFWKTPDAPIPERWTPELKRQLSQIGIRDIQHRILTAHSQGSKNWEPHTDQPAAPVVLQLLRSAETANQLLGVQMIQDPMPYFWPLLLRWLTTENDAVRSSIQPILKSCLPVEKHFFIQKKFCCFSHNEERKMACMQDFILKTGLNWIKLVEEKSLTQRL